MHASYSELRGCVIRPDIVDKENIHYLTFLRNPIERYISEFEHVRRGATWAKSVRKCLDQSLFTEKCYNGSHWSNVNWNDFLSCEHNLANNRQVRMLADFTAIGCNALKCISNRNSCTEDEKIANDELMLESAKETLMSISFFGILEHRELSQYLFERTFENIFKFNITLSSSKKTIAKSTLDENKHYLERIRENNHLDIRLYESALNLFNDRIYYLKSLQNKIN